MSKKGLKQTKSPKKLSSHQIAERSISRNDAWAQRILCIGMVLVCICIISVRDYFLGPVLIKGLDSGGQILDVFSLGKWTLLWLTTATIFIMFCYKLVVSRYFVIASPANMPVSLIVILIALSVLTSDYQGVALMGVPDIHFGTLPLLVLFLLFFLVLNIKPNDSLLFELSLALGSIILINIVINGGFFYGIIWKDVPGIQMLLVPGNVPAAAITGALESTFNNPNYVSGLFGALSAFFFALAATQASRNRILIHSILGSCSLLLVLLSLSTSGFVTFVALIPIVIIILFLNRSDANLRVYIITAVLLLTVGAGFFLNLHNPKVYEGSVGWIQRALNTVSIQHGGETTSVDEYIEPTDKFDLSVPTEASIDSSRLYIARETWKLIKARPLFGYGMDCMVYYFPFNSREAISNMGLAQILTKPHNMYLQLAVGGGLLVLLCFLWLVGAFLFHSTRIVYQYWRASGEIVSLLTSLIVFVTAFLIQGLVNDLTIGTATVFFVLLGVGFSLLNQPLEQNEIGPDKSNVNSQH